MLVFLKSSGCRGVTSFTTVYPVSLKGLYKIHFA